MSKLRTFALSAVALVAFAPAAAHAAAPATTSLQQDVTISWKGKHKAAAERATVQVPGIGTADVVCSKNEAYYRLYPTDPTVETTMWSTISQPSGDETSYNVKNARIYKFGTTTTTDPNSTGSGPNAQEGLNIIGPMTTDTKASAFGLISQRSALSTPGGSQPNPTTFAIEWKWSGLGGPVKKQRCKITAEFGTQLPSGSTVRTRTAGNVTQSPGAATSSLWVDWHGESDAPGKTVSSPIEVPYLGILTATCPTGLGSTAYLTLKTNPADGVGAYVETYAGSGPNGQTVTWLNADPTTGDIRIPLPDNGMVALAFFDDDNGALGTFSSLYKTNDGKPAENFCEIAGTTIAASAGTGGGGDDGPTAE